MNCLATKSRNTRSAFTLIELLTVIGIVILIAAIALPVVTHFKKGDAMLAATRQLLDAVHRGRQLAINEHTTVYMIFAPPTLYQQAVYFDPALTTPQQKAAITNALDKQQVGYTYICFRSAGDQPGTRKPHLLSAWQTLPESTFIPAWKFNLVGAGTRRITDVMTGEFFDVGAFDRVSIPFPSDSATFKTTPGLPCIVFDYQGRLVTPNGQPLGHDEYIPLAHGSVIPARDKDSRLLLVGPPDELEVPAGNSTNTFNVVHVDWLTGRARLERQVVR
jgi:type II secretory pathway pseudopilin PulG